MEQNKTLRDWYNEMPHPYNERAIRNATDYNLDVDKDIAETHKQAVNAFDWCLTPEFEIYQSYWPNAYHGRYPHATQPVAIASGDSINGQHVTVIEPAKPKVPVYQSLITKFEGKPDREILLLLVDQVNDLKAMFLSHVDTQRKVQEYLTLEMHHIRKELAELKGKPIVNSDIHQMD